MSRLDEIQAQMDAATPGPWTMTIDADRKWALVLASSGSADEYRVARSADDDDAEFIAASPENTRYLLDLARKQQAALALIANQLDAAELLCRMNGTGPEFAVVPVGAVRAALEAKP